MPDPAVRDHLALALDTDDLVCAKRWATELRDWFGVMKVGLELFTAGGPEAVAVLVEAGHRVFLDLKLHDIPNTVERAARVAGSLGVSYLTVHTGSSVDVTRAAVTGLRHGAEAAGGEAAVALGVTVLTSEAVRPPEVVEERMRVARQAGCGGIVCGASELDLAARVVPDLVTVVPGIRLPTSSADDQSAVATPEVALAAGADLLVIGRTVTAAPDHRAAAEAIHASCSGAAA